MSSSTSSKRRAIVVAALAGVVSAGLGGFIASRYRRDLTQARTRLARVDRKVVPTELGALEYATSGDGEPVLVIHGIFQGCDGTLLSARDLVVARRVIGPSRFGYLGSARPPGATPALQADAFAVLLDALGIDSIDVIGISAGTTSALQFALRHPTRVKRLVIVSGNWPGSPTAVVQPPVARMLYADPPMWLLKALAPTLLAKLMGVPKGLPLSAEDAGFLSEFADSIFPVAPRAAGALFDAFVSNADVNNYPIEELSVPVLVVHAADDPLASYDAASRATDRIPDATLLRVESGGHLLLGQGERVRGELATFLAPPIDT
jgi:pimeloyl-ACP methyl ester carboxylesterase